MNYNKQIQEITKYFRQSEKNNEEFKLGVEFEHFIVDKNTLKAISYFGEDGVQSTLKELTFKGWIGNEEEGNLLGLSKEGTTITLEPGAQIEISIKPYKEIHHIDEEYIRFLEDLIPILDRKNQLLVAMGYQPESKIEDISFIPKKRYEYMSEYLMRKGVYAHNMMKGTASMQVSVDYKSEEDYRKKYKVASWLSPVIGALYDNSPYFEGKLWKGNGVRINIWENCDKDRCGIIKGINEEAFGYRHYAEHILSKPPIFISKGDSLLYTKEALLTEVFNDSDYTKQELEHILTMYFPDVRTKTYIEIRMADSVPYPLNLTGAALWKGLLYNDEVLEEVYNYLSRIENKEIEKTKQEVIQFGLDAKLGNLSIYEISIDILKMAKKGLSKEEQKYLKPLEEILAKKEIPLEKTKNSYFLGKAESIEWCILNNKLGGR